MSWRERLGGRNIECIVDIGNSLKTLNKGKNVYETDNKFNTVINNK